MQIRQTHSNERQGTAGIQADFRGGMTLTHAKSASFKTIALAIAIHFAMLVLDRKVKFQSYSEFAEYLRPLKVKNPSPG
jgi:hypothetical protein